MSDEIKKDNEKTLEEILSELEGILEAIERDDVTLEDAMSLYEAGVGKIKICNEKLDMVEKKMRILEGREDEDK